MDFIARAGNIVDRGHRIIGIMLVIIVVLLCIIQLILTEKSKLQETINFQNRTQSIYVVPNSQAAVYKPASSKLLLSTFVDYITQSVLTYTPANYKKQYVSIRPFLSASLLEMADDFYYRQINQSKLEKLSSLFVADKTSTELSEFKELAEKTTQYGAKTYSVTVKGLRYYIIGGVVTETKDVHLTLNLQEVKASKTNPFGFIITKWTLGDVQ